MTPRPGRSGACRNHPYHPRNPAHRIRTENSCPKNQCAVGRDRAGQTTFGSKGQDSSTTRGYGQQAGLAGLLGTSQAHAGPRETSWAGGSVNWLQPKRVPNRHRPTLRIEPLNLFSCFPGSQEQTEQWLDSAWRTSINTAGY